VSVSGLVTLTAGTLSGSGALNANGGMLINPLSGGFNLDGRTVNNAAGQTATWTGRYINGDFVASDGSVFNNLGTFVADGVGFYKESGIGAPSSFNDHGNFIASGSANVDFSVPFNVPGGSVDIDDGSQLEFDQGGTSTDAAFIVDGGFDVENPYDSNLATYTRGNVVFAAPNVEDEQGGSTFRFSRTLDDR
jgi:hypothetical protein